MMPSDEKLMQQVAVGNMEAFGELVRRHQERARRNAYHYVGNRTEAEDLAQKAFLNIQADMLESQVNYYRALADHNTARKQLNLAMGK